MAALRLKRDIRRRATCALARFARAAAQAGRSDERAAVFGLPDAVDGCDQHRLARSAGQAIELYAGVVLPPGSYSGIKAWVREDALGGLISTPSRFRIELTAEQLVCMGAAVQPNQNSEEIDVTEFVRLGLLKPA